MLKCREDARLSVFPFKIEIFSADRTGLEPATSAVTGRHSNQLNYRSNSLIRGSKDK